MCLPCRRPGTRHLAPNLVRSIPSPWASLHWPVRPFLLFGVTNHRLHCCMCIHHVYLSFPPPCIPHTYLGEQAYFAGDWTPLLPYIALLPTDHPPPGSPTANRPPPTACRPHRMRSPAPRRPPEPCERSTDLRPLLHWMTCHGTILLARLYDNDET